MRILLLLPEPSAETRGAKSSLGVVAEPVGEHLVVGAAVGVVAAHGGNEVLADLLDGGGLSELVGDAVAHVLELLLLGGGALGLWERKQGHTGVSWVNEREGSRRPIT